MSMRILKILLGLVLALAVLVVAGGLMLPSGFKVSRSVVIDAPPAQVYALVANPHDWVHWSVWNQRDPAMQMSYSGPESGAGAGWAWKSKGEGDGSMQFTAAEPGQRVAFTLAFADFGTPSTGEFTFSPEGAGTRVTWTMDGDVGRNPLLRWFGLFADRLVGADFEAGLLGLKALAEKAPK
jgi:uncharacterized protein YndB with AHSA1/START domain